MILCSLDVNRPILLFYSYFFFSPIIHKTRNENSFPPLPFSPVLDLKCDTISKPVVHILLTQ